MSPPLRSLWLLTPAASALALGAALPSAADAFVNATGGASCAGAGSNDGQSILRSLNYDSLPPLIDTVAHSGVASIQVP